MGIETTLAARTAMRAEIQALESAAAKQSAVAGIRAAATRGHYSMPGPMGTMRPLRSDVVRARAATLPGALRSTVHAACGDIEAAAAELLETGIAADLFVDGASRGLTDLVVIPREHLMSETAQSIIAASNALLAHCAALATCVELAHRRIAEANTRPWYARWNARRTYVEASMTELIEIADKLA